MVYEQLLPPQGDVFFPSCMSTLSCQQQPLEDLRPSVRTLHPTAPAMPRRRPSFYSPRIQNGTYVFLRLASILPALVPPYEDFLKILARSGNTMTLDMHGRTDIVTIKRVKTAFLDTANY